MTSKSRDKDRVVYTRSPSINKRHICLGNNQTIQSVDCYTGTTATSNSCSTSNMICKQMVNKIAPINLDYPLNISTTTNSGKINRFKHHGYLNIFPEISRNNSNNNKSLNPSHSSSNKVNKQERKLSTCQSLVFKSNISTIAANDKSNLNTITNQRHDTVNIEEIIRKESILGNIGNKKMLPFGNYNIIVDDGCYNIRHHNQRNKSFVALDSFQNGSVCQINSTLNNKLIQLIKEEEKNTAEEATISTRKSFKLERLNHHVFDNNGFTIKRNKDTKYFFSSGMELPLRERISQLKSNYNEEEGPISHKNEGEKFKEISHLIKRKIRAKVKFKINSNNKYIDKAIEEREVIDKVISDSKFNSEDRERMKAQDNDTILKYKVIYQNQVNDANSSDSNTNYKNAYHNGFNNHLEALFYNNSTQSHHEEGFYFEDYTPETSAILKILLSKFHTHELIQKEKRIDKTAMVIKGKSESFIRGIICNLSARKNKAVRKTNSLIDDNTTALSIVQKFQVFQNQNSQIECDYLLCLYNIEMHKRCINNTYSFSYYVCGKYLKLTPEMVYTFIFQEYKRPTYKKGQSRKKFYGNDFEIQKLCYQALNHNINYLQTQKFFNIDYHPNINERVFNHTPSDNKKYTREPTVKKPKQAKNTKKKKYDFNILRKSTLFTLVKARDETKSTITNTRIQIQSSLTLNELLDEIELLLRNKSNFKNSFHLNKCIFRLLGLCIINQKEDLLRKYYHKYSTVFDINFQDENFDTLLIISCKLNLVNIVQFLLDQGIDTNIQNIHNNTALHYSVSHKHYNIVDLLVKNGANEHIKNNFGKNPWECLIEDCEKV